MSKLIFDIETVGENFDELDETTQEVLTKWIKKESANETEYWLNLWKDVGLVKSFEAEALLRELIEIERMLGASLLTLKDKR